MNQALCFDAVLFQFSRKPQFITTGAGDRLRVFTTGDCDSTVMYNENGSEI